jgi:hypothetical protein
MEAIILCKLQSSISLTQPPPFLPAHITSEEGLRFEGREAEAGYGSRARRGAAHLAKLREEADRKAANDDQRKGAALAKLQSAQDTGGGVIFTDSQDNVLARRTLSPGERLSWRVVVEMGAHFASWLDGVSGGQSDLKWTDALLQRQIVLINSEQKASSLLKELAAVDDFKVRGKPIFGPHGTHKLSSTTGSRENKLNRVLQYVFAEGRAKQSGGPETGDECTRWRLMTQDEIKAMAQKKKAQQRRPAGQPQTDAQHTAGPPTSELQDAGNAMAETEDEVLGEAVANPPAALASQMDAVETPEPPSNSDGATDSRQGTRRSGRARQSSRFEPDDRSDKARGKAPVGAD